MTAALSLFILQTYQQLQSHTPYPAEYLNQFNLMNIDSKEPKKLMGDPRAVAKQQIFNETVKNELRFLERNRTKDFALNPRKSKLPFFISQLTFSPASQTR